MTLIYRGQKYVQNKVAAKKQHTELTYRGKAYTSQLLYKNKKGHVMWPFFMAKNIRC